MCSDRGKVCEREVEKEKEIWRCYVVGFEERGKGH